MKSLSLKQILTYALIGGYCFFFYLMLKITFQYIPIDTDVAFLRIKQDYIVYSHYTMAFFIHVFFSIFALLAGFTQFSKNILASYPSLHRSLGYIYMVSILVFAAPTGFIIGVYANGGLSSQIAFCVLSLLWFYFTFSAFTAIKKRNIARHRNFMIRSFALTLSAITLRAWKFILVALFHPRPMDVYIVVAWLGWVLNLVIAEIIIYKSKK
ncbi:DUF2306 domain-containing protein [Aquimarina brevivitae]|uniref:Putative membrane protein n=1 Tax=Aquimarina brevivitae TaxID=323412 RepID=A0A4Q7PHT7_9FLAO|nr:DUF2306 domain-containing protein [Aquimarina brevivitae]RZS99518.1 putative membrane protein [Aquimarina brevivitae]